MCYATTMEAKKRVNLFLPPDVVLHLKVAALNYDLDLSKFVEFIFTYFQENAKKRGGETNWKPNY